MFKKYFLLVLFLTTIKIIKPEGEATKLFSTTAGLAAGLAAGYFSKPLFYKEYQLWGKSLKTEKPNDWVQALYNETKRMLKDKDFRDKDNEIKYTILAFRILTGVATFGFIKVLYI